MPDGAAPLRAGERCSVTDLDAGGVALALIGLFYGVGAVFTIRVSATGMLLTDALSSLCRVDPREQAAERNRARLLGLMAVLYGAGGIFLLLRLDLAAAVFAVSCALYGLYLYVIAPKWLDPWDPPEEPGRSSTRNAFFIYLGATAVVLGAWHAGALRPAAEADPWILAVAAILVLALAGYALRAFQPWHRHAEVAAAEPDLAEMPAHMVLTPSWDGTGLVDAASGEPVWYDLSRQDMPEADWQAITAWNDIYREAADPDDPLGVRFLAPEAEAKLEHAGRPIYERLVQRLGAERLSFEPTPRPNLPRQAFSACKIVIDHNGDPLHRMEADGEYFLAPIRSGLSWALVNALGDWANRREERLDPRTPGAPPLWSPEAAAAHHAEGRALAARLAEELAATGRAHVAVWYEPDGGKAERIA